MIEYQEYATKAELPPYVRFEYRDGATAPEGVKWSGKGSLPEIGHTVRSALKMSKGEPVGHVVGYCVIHDWLGVLVTRPDGSRGNAMGAEIETYWSGSPDPSDPDNYWIDDETGERVSAATGERTA